MNAVVKEEENMIEPKQEVEESEELKEPKVELVDKEDVKMEEIDDNEYQHMVPYEYRDNKVQHTEQERPKYEGQKPTSRSCQCQKCHMYFVLRYFSDAQKHAVTHTNLKKFECDQCGYESWNSADVHRHINRQHNNESCSVKKIQLSEEDRLELRKIASECFPGWAEITKSITINGKRLNNNDTPFEEEPTDKKSTNAKKLADQCKKCNKFLALAGFAHAKSHAVTHTSLKKFKCEKCDYGSWYRANVKKHINDHHKNEPCSVEDIQLSEEEKLELRRVAEECFPEMIKALKRRSTGNEKSVKVEEEHSTISRKRPRTSDAN